MRKKVKAVLMFFEKIALWWLIGSLIYIGLPIISGRANELTANTGYFVLSCLIMPIVSGFLLYYVITTL